jgi:hypothetical protein
VKARNFTLLLLILLSAVAQSSPRAQYLHPRLRSREVNLRTALILPPVVSIQREGMKGATSMIRESEEVGAGLSEIVSAALREKQISATSEPFSAAALSETGELKYVLADIQKRYDRLEPLLLKKATDVGRGRFSLGDEVAKLDANDSADALVFIRASGTKLTTGKKLYGIFVPGSGLWSRLSVSLAIVDSKTGDILFLAKFKVKGKFVEQPQQVLAQSVRKALQEFPAATLS